MNRSTVNQVPEGYIALHCIQEGSKLRVRVDPRDSQNYSPQVNIQFPRALRHDGAQFVVPLPLAISAGGRGKTFYRVRKAEIKILVVKTSVEKVFGDKNDECCVCLGNEVGVIFAPCGHYAVCEDCGPRMDKCPLCRQVVATLIDPADL